MMFIVTCIVVGLAIAYLLYSRWRPTSSIPAPAGLPLFGNLLQLSSEKAFVKIFQWAKNFPEGLMRIRLGFEDVIVVNDYRLIHQVLVENGKAHADRSQTHRIGMFSSNFSDITFMSYNRTQRLMKKVLLGHIKAYGSGLDYIQKVVLEGTSELVNKITTTNGHPCDIQSYIQDTVVDMLCILAFQRRSSSSEREDIKLAINSGSNVLAVGNFGELFDRIKLVQIIATPFWKTLNECVRTCNVLINKWLSGDLDQLNEKSLISKLLKQGIENKNIGAVLLNDTFGAGISTTSSTLLMLINILIHKAEIQQKLFDECQEVLNERTASLEDQQSMPYHQAVILEVLRYSSIAPFAIPHKTAEDTRLAGHYIPKGTHVWVNLWALHHDETFWEKPFDFMPERYLDGKGQLVLADHPNRRHTIPFGAGVRVCAGEVFARSRLFLMLACIVQNFKILPETTLENQPSCDCKDMTEGLPMFPATYKACFVPRENTQK